MNFRLTTLDTKEQKQAVKKLTTQGGWGFTACGKTHSGGRPGIYPGMKSIKSTPVVQPAKKLNSLKGHDFSRAASSCKLTWALAPEGCLAEATPPTNEVRF
jgi:hypothetical protein